MVVARAWREGEMKSSYLMGIEFHVYNMERVLWMDGGDGITTMSVYLI